MRTPLALLGLLALLPLVPGAPAQGCLGPHVFDCDVSTGPVTVGPTTLGPLTLGPYTVNGVAVGYTVDLRWWPIDAEWYHCDPVLGCQYYRLA